ncbi:bifunctional hydroxymethylpyrimidine kinase/phosphomethylpyrimidine kinase [Aurantivibrio plasticivorans]
MGQVGSSAKTPVVMSIAGSDSSAGAGIQADLKACSALGVYAATVITAVTAQNTLGVTAISPVPIDTVAAQIEAVFADLNVSAIKLGMLHSVGNVVCVARHLTAHENIPVVCDPVMMSTSGSALLSEEAVAALREELLPRVSIVTPNLVEAALLLDAEPATDEVAMIEQAEALLALSPNAVLLKGGHLTGVSATDVLVWRDGDNQRCEVFRTEKIESNNTHGTGCTLSSAIAALLVKGYAMNDAVSTAKEYVTHAIAHADQLHIGDGHGPLQHFYQ